MHFLSAVLLAALLASGCREERPPLADNMAARVGDEQLTEEDVGEALDVLPPGLDSLTARQQIVEQWVHTRLLAQEARRRGLDQQEDVKNQLAESERSVLAAALIDRFFETSAAEPTDEEIRTYFDANRENLTLREPYVRVRLLTTDSRARAQQARAAMIRSVDSPFADSLWNLTARSYATDPEGALALSDRYLPESRLRGLDRPVWERGNSMLAGEVSEVFESGGHHHVLQIVSRIAAGTTPEFPWIREELRQRLAIEKRNAMLAQQVRQLHNEARTDGRLEIR